MATKKAKHAASKALILQSPLQTALFLPTTLALGEGGLDSNCSKQSTQDSPWKGGHRTRAIHWIPGKISAQGTDS